MFKIQAYPFCNGFGSPIELLQELNDANFDRILAHSDYPRGMGKFIKSMLQKNSSKRAPAMELVNHEWIRSHGISDLADAQAVLKEVYLNFPLTFIKGL